MHCINAIFCISTFCYLAPFAAPMFTTECYYRYIVLRVVHIQTSTHSYSFVVFRFVTVLHLYITCTVFVTMYVNLFCLVFCTIQSRYYVSSCSLVLRILDVTFYIYFFGQFTYNPIQHKILEHHQLRKYDRYFIT